MFKDLTYHHAIHQHVAPAIAEEATLVVRGGVIVELSLAGGCNAGHPQGSAVLGFFVFWGRIRSLNFLTKHTGTHNTFLSPFFPNYKQTYTHTLFFF